jgi:hypothetical protein
MKELLYVYVGGFIAIFFVVMTIARVKYNPKNSDPLLVQANIILRMSMLWFVLVVILIWSLSIDLISYLRPKLSKCFQTLSLYLSCQQARIKEWRLERAQRKEQELKEWVEELHYQKGSTLRM